MSERVVLPPFCLFLPIAAACLRAEGRPGQWPAEHRQTTGYPFGRFLGWLAGLGVYLAAIGLWGPGRSFTEMLLYRLTVAGPALSAIWLLLGLEVARVGLDLGATVTRRVQGRVGAARFLQVGTLATLLPALAMALLLVLLPGLRVIPSSPDPVSIAILLVTLGPPFVPLIWALGRHLVGRWHARSAAAALSLSVVLVTMVLAFLLGALSQPSFAGLAPVRPAQIAILAIGGLLCGYRALLLSAPRVSGTAWTARSFEQRFTLLGAAVWIVGGTLTAALQQTTTPSPGTVGFRDGTITLFMVGLAVACPLYLVWVAWRRPARLVEEPATIGAVGWLCALLAATVPELGPALGSMSRRSARRVGALVRAAPGWLRDRARAFVTEALVDTRGLPRETCFLIWFGYACFVGIVGLAVWIEFFGEDLPTLTYVMRNSTLTAPAIQLPVAMVMYVVGWALVLTGATDLGWRGFLPLLALLAVDLLYQAWFISTQNASLAWGSAVMLVLAAIAVQVGTRRHPGWRQHPLLEFFGWTIALSLYLAFTWKLTETSGVAGLADRAIMTRLLWIGILLSPFWMYLGVEPARLGLELGESVVDRLRARLDAGGIRRVASLTTVAFILMLIPYYLVATIMAIAFWSIMQGSRVEAVTGGIIAALMVPISLWPAALLLVALRRLIGRRSSTAAATLWIRLSAAAFVLTAATLLAVSSQQDFMMFALSLPNLVDPFVLYVALMSLTLLTFGAQYANAEGHIAPRTGRALVYFGLTTMVLCAALLPTSHHSWTRASRARWAC